MWPRMLVTSNQSRLRSVCDALAIAPSIASLTPSGDVPVISTDLYTWFDMRAVSRRDRLEGVRAEGGHQRVGDQRVLGPRELRVLVEDRAGAHAGPFEQLDVLG